MIAILNYQAGNLKSLSNALLRQGFDVTVTTDPEVLLAAELAIIPGVGAFGDAMAALETSQLMTPLKTRHLSGKPILGICLGMQLFFETSEESSMLDGPVSGLGFMKGHIKRLYPNDVALKVPHMGWNQLNRLPNPQTGGADGFPERLLTYDGQNVYFVHSYGLIDANPSEVLYTTDHGQTIPALVYRPALECPAAGALLGFQFHPEKSGPMGETLLADAIQLLINLR